MSLAAHRTGRLLNQADVARDAALTHPTTHRYLNLLETGCLVTRIRPFAPNPNVARVKTPAEATTRPDAGFWLEQALFQTLQTWRALDPLRRKHHFCRDRPGNEVDFILEENGQLVTLEIKTGSTLTNSDAAGKHGGLGQPLAARLLGRQPDRAHHRFDQRIARLRAGARCRPAA